MQAENERNTQGGQAPLIVIVEELGRLGWNESDLALWRKSDPAKRAIGARLRKETTLSIKGIFHSPASGNIQKRKVRFSMTRFNSPSSDKSACCLQSHP